MTRPFQVISPSTSTWLARLALLSLPLLSGCDPMLEVDGAFFPGWLLCLLVAFIPTLGVRALLRRTNVESHCRPLSLTYTSQYFTFVFLVWLLLFRD